MNPDSLGAIILATGALGTVAFGIVEGLKWTPLGEIGFGSIVKILGPLNEALRVAYGDAHELLLRGQYRGDQKELVRSLRQGVRVGLTDANAAQVARFLGSIDGEQLKQAVAGAEKGTELPTGLRNVLGRFELAADARIDAALAVAQSRYVGFNRVSASAAAILIAVIAGPQVGASLTKSLLVGLAAVPLAPIAKDVASAIQSASQALKGKKRSTSSIFDGTTVEAPSSRGASSSGRASTRDSRSRCGSSPGSSF